MLSLKYVGHALAAYYIVTVVRAVWLRRDVLRTLLHLPLLAAIVLGAFLLLATERHGAYQMTWASAALLLAAAVVFELAFRHVLRKRSDAPASPFSGLP